MARKPRIIQIQATDVTQGLKTLAAKFSANEIERSLRNLAQSIIHDAVMAPIPRDTGLLARSHAMQSVGSGAKVEILFGFNRVYAACQDSGRLAPTRMIPKKYGSDVGPNRYFSMTWRHRRPKFYADMVKLLSADFAGIAARLRTRRKARS